MKHEKIKYIMTFLIMMILIHPVSSLDTKTIEYDKLWSIKIYYITQNNVYNDNYKTIIDNGMNKANKMLKNYDGTSLQWTIEKVDIPSNVNIGNDIFIGYSNENKVIKNIPNFKTKYDTYDVTFLVIHGTKGGAYSVNYMSPIWFSWKAFEKDVDSLGGNGIVHEFLHPFGLRDVNKGQYGCIMGDLYISKLNLCDQYYLFKPENYKKTPSSEWFIDEKYMQSPTIAETPKYWNIWNFYLVKRTN